MKKITFLMVLAAVFVISFSAVAQTYPPVDNTSLKELWLKAQSVNPDTVKWMNYSSSTQRGFVFYDGKLYFTDFAFNKLIVVDAVSADSIGVLPLPAAAKGIRTVSGLGVDEAGNMFACNLQTTAEKVGSEFLVYRWEYDFNNNKYKEPTVFITYSFKDDPLYNPEDGSVRVGDGFCVYGDLVNGDGWILVPITTNTKLFKKMMKWTIKAGAVTKTEFIDMKYRAAAITNNGTAPFVEPYNADLFYLDTNLGLPELYNMQGEAVSYFTGVQATGLYGAQSPTNVGANGIISFKSKGRHFVVAAGNNHATGRNIPQNTAQLFELTDPDKGLESAKLLYNLPDIGLGSKTNDIFRVAPQVDLIDADKGKVRIYIFAARNGFGAFELTIQSTGTPNIGENGFGIATNIIENGKIKFEGRNAKLAEIFSLNGQKIISLNNASEINVSKLNGVYMLRAIDSEGNSINQKLIIK